MEMKHSIYTNIFEIKLVKNFKCAVSLAFQLYGIKTNCIIFYKFISIRAFTFQINMIFICHSIDIYIYIYITEITHATVH